MFIVVLTVPASALTPGRAWAPVETLIVNGHEYMVPDRFEPPRDGRIELLASGYHGVAEPTYGHRTYGLVWQDSSWGIRWSMDEPAYRMWPALTTPDLQMLVWKTTLPRVDNYYSFLVTADVVNGVVTKPDTIARVAAEALVYSGTAWGTRRWVAVRDEDFTVPGIPEVLRIYRSDAPGVWRLMGATGMTGRNGMRLIALDSSTVMLLSSDFLSGLRWGYLRDTVFVEQTPKITEDRLVYRPALSRMGGAGRMLAAWNAAPDIPPDYSDRIVIGKYSQGSWAAPETLSMRWPTDGGLLFYDLQFSPEGSEHPAITWFGYSSLGDAADYVWASCPTDSGFGVGERIEGSRYGLNPLIYRDENGDIWVAWWDFVNGIYWTHSHTNSLPSAPQVADLAGRPELRWTLSEPSPETWWAVLRAQGDGDFEPVARVRAGADTLMSWSDTTAPSGVALRYAIRRECRDVRSRLTSAEARWEPRGPSLALLRKGENPTAGSFLFEVVGANRGPCTLSVYDLQGREVERHTFDAAGAGRDAAELRLGNQVRTGLYLVRVRTWDGRTSAAAKLAVVR